MADKKLTDAETIFQFRKDEDGNMLPSGAKDLQKQLFEMFGISADSADEVQTEIFKSQIEYLLHDIDEEEQSEVTRRTNFILSQLQAMDPGDPVEAMLCLQLIGIHNATLKSIGQTINQNATTDSLDRFMGYTQKLSSTSAKLANTLRKYRNNGAQKVTVKHVHVHEGGQAAIGNFEGTGEGGE